MRRLKLGIIFGGMSEEHPVSVKSAQEIARHLDLESYEPFYIGITRQGSWRLCDGPSTNWEEHEGSPQVMLSPDRSINGLLVLEHGEYKTIPIDVVFPVLHGKCGEDGAMQGLLELAGIPYRRLRYPELSGVHGQIPCLHASPEQQGSSRRTSGRSCRMSCPDPDALLFPSS